MEYYFKNSKSILLFIFSLFILMTALYAQDSPSPDCALLSEKNPNHVIQCKGDQWYRGKKLQPNLRNSSEDRSYPQRQNMFHHPRPANQNQESEKWRGVLTITLAVLAILASLIIYAVVQTFRNIAICFSGYRDYALSLLFPLICIAGLLFGVYGRQRIIFIIGFVSGSASLLYAFARSFQLNGFTFLSLCVFLTRLLFSVIIPFYWLCANVFRPFLVPLLGPFSFILGGRQEDEPEIAYNLKKAARWAGYSAFLHLLIRNSEETAQVRVFRKYKKTGKMFQAGKSGRAETESSKETLDPHEILGVSSNASPEEIQKAYHEQAQKYHPDKVSYLGKEFQEYAAMRMTMINQAYQTLRPA